MPELGRLWVSLETRAAVYNRAMDAAQGRATQLTRSWGSLTTTIRRSAAFVAAAGALRLIDRAMERSLQTAARFQTELAMVGTMLRGNVSPMLAQFRNDLMRMASQYGEDTSTLSRGLYDILSASIAASKATEFLDVAVRAAQGGFSTTAVSADALTTIVNACCRRCRRLRYVIRNCGEMQNEVR